MIRINPVVSEEAKKIYDSWPPKKKHEHVSKAIVQYGNKETFTPEQKKWIRQEIEKRLKELEGK